MTSQLLTRVPTSLKQQFKIRSKERGVSMDYLINVFIRTYTENPDILTSRIEMEKFDRDIIDAWSHETVKNSFISLDNVLRAKGLS